jgi:hypothetical protein
MNSNNPYYPNTGLHKKDPVFGFGPYNAPARLTASSKKSPISRHSRMREGDGKS